jgi:hypothetical protein
MSNRPPVHAIATKHNQRQRRDPLSGQPGRAGRHQGSPRGVVWCGCICGGACEEGAIPVPASWLRRYLAEHPGHGFFHDEEGNVTMVLDWRPVNPDVRAAPDLETLLDELDALPVADPSQSRLIG